MPISSEPDDQGNGIVIRTPRSNDEHSAVVNAPHNTWRNLAVSARATLLTAARLNQPRTTV